MSTRNPRTHESALRDIERRFLATGVFTKDGSFRVRRYVRVDGDSAVLELADGSELRLSMRLGDLTLDIEADDATKRELREAHLQYRARC